MTFGYELPTSWLLDMNCKHHDYWV